VATDASVRETARLISSDKVEGTSVRRSDGDKVEGTSVRRSDGDKVGTIEHVMIDKQTGRVVYAAMSFGGFLGMGSEYRALPWSALRYNERIDAYELNVTDDQLRNAPVATTDFFENGMADRQWEDSLHRHYRAAPYW
jgi:sporulation protein YlmC with PRC-barrel domain